MFRNTNHNAPEWQNRIIQRVIDESDIESKAQMINDLFDAKLEIESRKYGAERMGDVVRAIEYTIPRYVVIDVPYGEKHPPVSIEFDLLHRKATVMQ